MTNLICLKENSQVFPATFSSGVSQLGKWHSHPHNCSGPRPWTVFDASLFLTSPIQSISRFFWLYHENTSWIWLHCLHYHLPSVNYHHLPPGLLQEPLDWSCHTQLSPCSIQSDHFSASISSFIDPAWNLQGIPITLGIKSKVLTMECQALMFCPLGVSKLMFYPPPFLCLGSSPIAPFSVIQTNCMCSHLGHRYSPNL